MPEDIDELAGRLYDYAASKPEGFTRPQAIGDLELSSRATFCRSVQRLRRTLGTDEINLVCDPQGESEPWRYRLVGNVDAARGWTSNRMKDLEGRLETLYNVSFSLTNATDGRTVEGRKARKIKKVVGRLIEDLAEIKDDGQMGLLLE